MKSHINLLPTRTMINLRIARCIRQWLVVAGCTLAVIIVATVIQWKRLESSGVELIRLKSSAAPLRQLENEINAMQQQLEQWNTRASLAAQLVDQRTMLSLLGLVSRATEKVNGTVCVHHFSVQPLGLAPRHEFIHDQGSTLRKLKLHGVGQDNVSVAQFMAALRESQAFHDVQLKSTETAQQESLSLRNYQVECIF